MSSYLNFYLVPKKKNNEEQEPLFIYSYSRSTDVYQEFYKSINPAFIGSDEDEKTHYTELTTDLVKVVLNNARESYNKGKKAYENRLKAYKELSLTEENFDEAIEDISSSTAYLEEFKETISEIEFIAGIVESLPYSEFEKVLINID